MFDDIDFKKLTEQEPEFAEFVKNATYESWLMTKEGKKMLKTMHSFYSIGMDVRQVAQFMANAMRETNSDD